jgi:hypothetical protein
MCIRDRSNISMIENGSSSALLSLIETGNSSEKLNALLAASPYLSDEVLIAYLNSSPSNGDLLDVILENSPVSVEVKSILDSLIIPSNIRNVINATQLTDLSSRTKLELEIIALEEQTFRTIDDLLREVIFDSTQTRTFDDLIPILNSRKELIYKELLVNAHIIRNDAESAAEGLSFIEDYQRTNELDDVLIKMMSYEDEYSYLNNHSEVLEFINSLSKDTVNIHTASRALELLNLTFNNTLDDSYSFIEEEASEKRMFLPANQSLIFNNEEEFTIYPNPFKNEIKILTNKKVNHHVVIYDLTGAIVFNAVINDLKTTIQLDNLKKGIYLLSIFDDEQHLIQTNRILKD